MIQNKEYITVLEVLQKAVSRIDKIVNSLKTYSRVDSDEIKNVNIHKTIEETLSLTATIYVKQEVKINTNFKATDSIIRGNAEKLEQVIMNLLSNAKDAIGFTGEINIETFNKKDSIVINVTDTGTGIKEEHLLRIFDTFYTTKAPGQGTGLGLGICLSIVEGMGGTMAVESKENLGTTFSIIFPLLSKIKNSEDN